MIVTISSHLKNIQLLCVCVCVCLQPLSDIQKNAPNIVYEVSWKKKDMEEWNSINTTKAKHMVHDTETYEPFHIKIQAINDFGRGPESAVVLGYSGEDCKSWLPGEGPELNWLFLIVWHTTDQGSVCECSVVIAVSLDRCRAL